MKKNKPLLAIIFLAMLGIFTSACSGRAVQATGWPGLTANDTTAFIAYSNHVYAVNLVNGTEKWRYPNESEGLTFFAEPAFGEDGHLVVGDYGPQGPSFLHLLDQDSGAETIIGGKWPFARAQDPYIAMPLATEEGIYAASSDGRLYAIDYQGNSLWTSFETEDAIWAAPSFDDEHLYLASLDHKLYAIDRSNGREVWSADLEGAIVGSPAVNDTGTLFVGTFGSEMIALDAETGNIQWQFPTQGWVWSGPALGDERVYFGDLSGEFYAVSQASGTLVWSYTADGTITGSPLITSTGIYFTTEAGSIIALNQNGTPRWTQTIDGKFHSAPILAGDLILASPIDSDAFLFAFNPEGGQVWSFVPQED
jgi:outer membrane protein assembly factor BamB